MEDFDTSGLIVRGTERVAFGYADPRAMVSLVSVERGLPSVGEMLFPFDAEARGYDMVIWRPGPWSHHGAHLA